MSQKKRGRVAERNLVYVLWGIHIIVGEEQLGAAKVACLRKCRYGPRIEFSLCYRGEVLAIGHWSEIHIVPEEMK